MLTNTKNIRKNSKKKKKSKNSKKHPSRLPWGSNDQNLKEIGTLNSEKIAHGWTDGRPRPMALALLTQSSRAKNQKIS